MPQARDEAGNIWETDAQGNAVRLVQPAGASTAPLTYGTPDPSIPRKAAAEEKRLAMEEARFKQQQREFNATHNPDGTPKANATATKLANIPAGAATGIQENLKTLRSLNDALVSLKARPQSIGTGTGMLGDKFTQWHDPEGTTTRSLIAAVGAQKIHDLSGAAVSASEAPRFTPFVPTVTDTPEVAKQKLERFRAELQGQIRESASYYTPENGYRPYKTPGLDAALGGSNAQQRADNEVPGQDNGAALAPGTAPVDPGSMPPANTPGGGNPPLTPWDQPNPSGGLTVASGPTRTIHSDRLSAQVDAMMNAGASKPMIDTVLKQQGFPPIEPSTFTAATQWMKKNPGQKYFGANVDREEPLGLMAQAAGSAPGAFLAQMSDAATAGTVGALAGDKGRGALDAMDKMHPDASMAGSIIGGITGAGAAEAGLTARGGTALSRYAPRIADALYGGLSGFNGARNGEGLQGAAMGAGLGVVGGAAGEGAMRAAGSAFRGVRDPAVDYLRARGVPMTVGQIAGQGGFIGRGVKKIEDAMTSLPGVGNMIDARRVDGLEGFNRAAFDVGAETTGDQVQDIGAAGLGQLRQAVGDNYDRALDPVHIDPTEPQFNADLMDNISAAQAIPNEGDASGDAALAALGHRFTNAVDPTTGLIAGRDFQESYRGLARTGRERANRDYGHEVGQVMRGGQDTLAGALERQHPGAYPEFLNANQANRRMMVLADATNAAKNQERQMFTPAQLNAADANSATRLMGRVNSASGNRPFAQLAEAGQAVLPSKLPDSGTATRALVGAGLTGALGGGGALAGGSDGAATGGGIGLGATLALMLGGTRGAQQAASRLLLDRPDLALRVGQGLADHARIGRWTGTGALTPLLVGQ